MPAEEESLGASWYISGWERPAKRELVVHARLTVLECVCVVVNCRPAMLLAARRSLRASQCNMNHRAEHPQRKIVPNLFTAFSSQATRGMHAFGYQLKSIHFPQLALFCAAKK